jgi:hypothetical protein
MNMDHGNSLEFFRPDHGHEQIDKQQQRNNSDNDVPHKLDSLELLAKTDVEGGYDKEAGHDRDEYQIVHSFFAGPQAPAWSNNATAPLGAIIKMPGQAIKKA